MFRHAPPPSPEFNGFEEYCDTIDSLTIETARQCTQLQELGSSREGATLSAIEDFLNEYPTLSPTELTQRLRRLAKSLRKLNRYAEEKVVKAGQVLDMVNEKFAQLDEASSHFLPAITSLPTPSTLPYYKTAFLPLLRPPTPHLPSQRQRSHSWGDYHPADIAVAADGMRVESAGNEEDGRASPKKARGKRSVTVTLAMASEAPSGKKRGFGGMVGDVEDGGEVEREETGSKK
ncbi:hypothetical protein HDV00_009100 [Rhizophlyctis rosea]|nr:hypothetical protein HDV00_009100 [Rhizophlyctis rosea]